MTAIEPLYPLSTYAVPRSSAPPQIEGKDYLVLTYDLEEDVKALELALSESEKIFQRGGRLVRVIDDVLANEPGSSQIPLRIQSISPSALRLILSEVKHFLRENQEGFKPVYPPVDLVNALLEKGRYPFLHHLRGVTQVPVLRRDGSIVQDEGYDRSTELLYQPLANFPRVREMPTEQEIKGALGLLLEVVVDFPFADPQMGQAVFLAAVFSVLGRCAFPGPVPMILVGANMPGTGKSKLADAIGLISTGQTIPRSNQLQSESEERKRITAILSKGHRLYLIDNVSGPLGGPCLDALLTSDAWADRILSKSLEVTLPNNLLVIATGNNLQVKADTARRCLLIQMLSMEEHPEARSNFHHPDLEAWIAEHQAALLTAALTILRGYVAAGRPVQAIATLGSYGGWSALIQSTVKWALGVDPGEARIPVGEGIGETHFGLHGAVMGSSAKQELLHAVTGNGVEHIRQLRQHPDLLALADGAGRLELAAGLLQEDVEEVEGLLVLEDLIAIANDPQDILSVAVDGCPSFNRFGHAWGKIRAKAVELFLANGVVQTGGGDGFRAGELLFELNPELMPGALAGEGHGIAIEVVHWISLNEKAPSMGWGR